MGIALGEDMVDGRRVYDEWFPNVSLYWKKSLQLSSEYGVYDGER